MTDPEIVKNITDPTMVFWTVLVDKLPEILTALGILIVAVQNILNRKQQKQELTEARATVEKKVDENTAITAEVAHQVVRRLAEVRAKPDEEDKDFRGV